MCMNKTQLRHYYKQIRMKRITHNDYHSKLRFQLSELLKAKNIKEQGLKIGSYINICGQQVIPPYIKQAKYYYPRINKSNKKMYFQSYQKENKYILGLYGIKIKKRISQITSQNQQFDKSLINQNDKPTILLVPLLCFNKNNLHRLGYGGGYYDRYISTLSQTLIIGIGLQELKIKQQNMIQFNKWDQKMNNIITEQNIY